MPLTPVLVLQVQRHFFWGNEMVIKEGDKIKIPDGLRFAGRWATVLYVFLYGTTIEMRNGKRVEFSNRQLAIHGMDPELPGGAQGAV